MKDLKSAKRYLRRYKRKSTSTVIFDIDGTLVKNDTHCILPVIELYYYVLGLGYHIFIITARLRESANITYTIDMLEKCGIYSYKGLMMRPEYELNLHKYKRDQRKFLHDNGYDIVMSVGDSDFDFGDYGGLSVKV